MKHLARQKDENQEKDKWLAPEGKAGVGKREEAARGRVKGIGLVKGKGRRKEMTGGGKRAGAKRGKRRETDREEEIRGKEMYQGAGGYREGKG
jgi:hypothetical protein